MTVIKTAWYRQIDFRQMEQKEIPEINSCIYSTLTFDKGLQEHTIGEEQSFQQVVQGELDFHMPKKAVRPQS